MLYVRPLTAILLFLLMTSDFKILDSQSEYNHQFRVVGYLPDYRVDQLNLSYIKLLTDLIYFSIEPDGSGGLDLSRINESSFGTLREVTRKHNVRFLISIGGWGRSQGFPSMALNKDLRHNFIHQLKNFCLLQKIDGVDFDWEFPKNPEETSAYEKLLIETKSVFSKFRLLVTVAVNPHTKLGESVYQIIDYIHLMSYDHPDQHSTYQQSLSDVSQQLRFGIQPGKLCLGIPFYGRSIQNWNQAMAYSDLARQFDLSEGVDLVEGIYFNGPQLVRKKVQYSLEKKLAGVMIWEIGQDTTDQTSLLQTINQTLNR